MDERLKHIEQGIEKACGIAKHELQADCRPSEFRYQGGSVIDLLFVVGEMYGRRTWIMPVIEPQTVQWNVNEPPPMTTEFRTVNYQAVRVMGQVHHPIQRGFWEALGGELVAEFLKHQPD